MDEEKWALKKADTLTPPPPFLRLPRLSLSSPRDSSGCGSRGGGDAARLGCRQGLHRLRALLRKGDRDQPACLDEELRRTLALPSWMFAPAFTNPSREKNVGLSWPNKEGKRRGLPAFLKSRVQTGSMKRWKSGRAQVQVRSTTIFLTDDVAGPADTYIRPRNAGDQWRNLGEGSHGYEVVLCRFLACSRGTLGTKQGVFCRFSPQGWHDAHVLDWPPFSLCHSLHVLTPVLGSEQYFCP